MSIQIPCPECGRELKLPDRSLLGRKGKCPKCQHTFILEEPAAITLQLAKPDSTSTGSQLAVESRGFPDLITPKSAVGVPTAAVLASPATDFAALGSAETSKSTAARMKELQKKNARRRNVGLAITGVLAIGIAVAVVMNLPGPKTPDQIVDKQSSTSTNGDTSDSASTDADSVALSSYAQLGSPTKGKPIELQYIPFGTQVVLNIHPAALWKEGSLGEELRYCVPPVAKLIETTLNDLFKRKPNEVEELLICLLPGPRGSLPEVAAVAHFVDEQKRSQLSEQFGHRNEKFAESVYVSGERAYLIIDQKTVAMCPNSQVQEMVDAMKQPHPAEQIDPLLPKTDRDRQITVLFTPLTLGLQETWFPENVRPFVKNSLDWLGSETEAVSWSFHVTDELFYSELLLRNKTTSAKKFEQQFKEKLAGLAGELVPLIQLMNPTEQGKRMVIGRVPAMVEVFSMATITEHDKNSHIIKLVTPLPDRAAANLALGTLLVWDESTRTDFSKAKPYQPDTSNLPALVADRLKMKIDVDFRATPLNEAFSFLAGEIRTPIELDGDALKAGGFTKNIKQEFRMDKAPVQEVILKIFAECKGIDPNPEKTLVIVVDETKKSIYVTTLAGAGRKKLNPYPISKG